MQNSDVAHNFFYDNHGRFNRWSMNVSYGGGVFWSYGTAIGELTEDINGNTVCIISDDNFSNTTSKHIGVLAYACPHQVYYLPQEYGSSAFYVESTIQRLSNRLEYYSKAKLTQKPNREGLSHNYQMLLTLLELKKFQPEHKNIKKILRKYKTLYEDINSPEKLKQIKEIQAKREKQQKAKLQRELNAIFKNYDYLTILKNTYEYDSIFDSDIKEKLRKYYNPKNELSFIWLDGDKVRTSQHLSVDAKEALTMLKLWKHGKLKHGMKISFYTVLEVMEKYVKIGCHKIPVENLNALYEAYIKMEDAA